MRAHQRIQHDPDLATREHDEIHTWLDGHAAEVVHMLSVLHNDRDPVIQSKEWESVVKSGTYVKGFLDLLVSCTAEVEWEDDKGEEHRSRWGVSYAFEVKSHLQSVGDVIRQIRLYQTGLDNARFVLVCPGVTSEQGRILKEQGIDTVVPTRPHEYSKYEDEFLVFLSYSDDGRCWIRSKSKEDL